MDIDTPLNNIPLSSFPEIKLQETLSLLVEKNLQSLNAKDFALRLKLFERNQKNKFEIKPSKEPKKFTNFRGSMTRQFRSKDKNPMLTGMLSTQMMTGALATSPMTLLQRNDWKLSSLCAFFNAKLDFLKMESQLLVESKFNFVLIIKR
jgi:hypothetical protein